jgi:hypothetical protein
MFIWLFLLLFSLIKDQIKCFNHISEVVKSLFKWNKKHFYILGCTSINRGDNIQLSLPNSSSKILINIIQ